MQRGMIVVTLAVATLGGCTADGGEDGAILVLKNVAPSTGCVVTAAADELFISHGSLDSALSHGYLFIAQVKSRLSAIAGTEDMRTILISGARIDITFPGSTLFDEAGLADLKARGLTHFRQLFSAPLSPNGSITDVGFELIPGALVQAMAAKAGGPFDVETLATFTMEGHQAGNEVQSQEFSYAVTVGTGRSVINHGACPLEGEVRPGSACNPTQDGVVDCCTEAGVLLCPGTKAQ
ncbi:MAG: hypothetical protein ABIY55_11655 [Kofleriaceae bacterium]